MPATIIIRIEDDAHAREIMAAGAKDIAQGFLPEANIHPSRVSICYRTPEDERAASNGELDYKERRDVWPNDQVEARRQ